MSFFENTRKPVGFGGKIMVAMMNLGHSPVARWGLRFLELAPDARVLDCGCGGGANIKRLLKKCPQGIVRGVDYSAVSVEKARNLNRTAIQKGRCAVWQGSVEHIIFAKDWFDAVTAFETVYFWSDLPQCLREVRRVLKPGGTFLICNESSGDTDKDEKWTEIIGGMTIYKDIELKAYLEQDGMEVDCAYDGEEAVEKAKDKKYDIILLDLMLPKMDGLEVCQQIREFSNVPIVMLTAKGEDMDKILGLEYGADDYITKPFNILEVKARIKAIMRRAGSDHEEKEKAKSIQVGDLRMDCEGRRVFIAGKEINLTAKEFDVLELLVFNPNKVYSRENLLNIVWGYEYPGDVRTVDVHIRRLREKIETNPSEPKYVHTKWGVGYYFQAQ